MKNWRLSPVDKSVAEYVECYWYLEKERQDKGPVYPKLYPDPSAHIITTNAGNHYSYTHENASIRGNGCHCLYPHRKTFILDHTQPFRILGIKLRIGALYSTDFTAHQTKLDNIADLNADQLFSTGSFSTEYLMDLSRNSPQEVRDYLDGALNARLQYCREDRHSKLTRKTVPMLTSVPVSELGFVLNCSQRTIERSFLQVTGITLKQCQTMLRFEEILEYLHKLESTDINWLDVVAKFGFSDQPHLIRHLKSCIGATPTEYAGQRDLTIDIYGNFEFD